MNIEILTFSTTLPGAIAVITMLIAIFIRGQFETGI